MVETAHIVNEHGSFNLINFASRCPNVPTQVYPNGIFIGSAIFIGPTHTHTHTHTHTQTMLY